MRVFESEGGGAGEGAGEAVEAGEGARAAGRKAVLATVTLWADERYG